MSQPYGLRRAALILVSTSILLLAAAGCNPGTGQSLGGRAAPSATTEAPAPPTPPAAAASSAPSASQPAPDPRPVTAAGAPCTASGLAFVSSFSQGAMGTAFTTYTVRNRGTAPCTLRGVPALIYIGADGQRALVPGEYGGSGVVTLAAGGTAHFAVAVGNGLSGYTPGSSNCAHPATFGHVSAMLPDGSSLALGAHAGVSYQCGEAEIAGWTTGPV
jgi:hypothetical protein